MVMAIELSRPLATESKPFRFESYGVAVMVSVRFAF